ncbi:MAG: ABC transporter substrate-binding protein [Proteobacteria bacterium]|nr:ABC transporter substrate-binding protein [Desulfobacula sp.]MBU3954210.1 ABC transporter substrate-binding protein [Pseudomonadota bacterium]MBU4130482.1 ABC transporter substrate-binding protein [Pseudomonadota bacterium]
MKILKRILRLLCSFLILGMICHISPLPGQERQKQDQISIIDGNGQTMQVNLPVERIVVEYTDNAELVRLLNQTDKVVGVAGYDYIFQKCRRQFPEFMLLPSVGYPWAMDYEAVFGLDPDLVLTFTSQTRDKQANLPGIVVLFLGLYHPDLAFPETSAYVRGIRNLGRLLNAEDRAQAYLSWYKGVLNTIADRTGSLKQGQKPRVLISSYPRCNSAGSSYCAYSAKDTLSQASSLAGGQNLVDLLPVTNGVSLPVDSEWVIRENPDIILLHAVDDIQASGYETDEALWLERGLAEFMARPELIGVKAIKDKKVFVLDGHFRNDASGGALAAAYLAVLFHPDLFKDIDPEALHREYLEMQGLAYDLDEHGIFFFPPLAREKGLAGIPNRYPRSIK